MYWLIEDYNYHISIVIVWIAMYTFTRSEGVSASFWCLLRSFVILLHVHYVPPVITPLTDLSHYHKKTWWTFPQSNVQPVKWTWIIESTSIFQDLRIKGMDSLCIKIKIINLIDILDTVPDLHDEQIDYHRALFIRE